MTPLNIDPPLRYAGAAVTLAEVPEEISLTVSITLLPDLDALIGRYAGLITCVCLMGEGQNFRE